MPKVKCPQCDGKGHYTWTDSGYGVDRYYTENCDRCNQTGKILIEVPANIFKRFDIKTWEELDALEKLFEYSIKNTTKKLEIVLKAKEKKPK